jgi:hypothetical protein
MIGKNKYSNLKSTLIDKGMSTKIIFSDSEGNFVMSSKIFRDGRCIFTDSHGKKIVIPVLN